MNPRDIRIRLRESEIYAEGVRETTSRTWPLDPTLAPEAGCAAFVNGKVVHWTLWAQFYVSFWGDERHPPVIGVNVGSASGTWNDLQRLPAVHLRRLAAMKQIYEDWLSGKIPELPIDCPPEILALT